MLTLQIVKTGHLKLDNLISRHLWVFDGQCKEMKGGQHHIDLEKYGKPISSGATRAIVEPHMPSDLVKQDIFEPV